MSKKLTVKDLLQEVQSIKKQASSGLNKPETIEYETESELHSNIDSALQDVVDGFGFLGATNIVVKGNTAYVKVEGEVQLDVLFKGAITLNNINKILEEITNGAISEANNSRIGFIWGNASPSGFGTFAPEGDENTKQNWGFYVEEDILDALAYAGVSEKIVYGPLQEIFGWGGVPTNKFPKEFLTQYKQLSASPYFTRGKRLNWTGDYQTDVGMLKKEAQQFLQYDKQYAQFIYRLAKWAKAKY